MFRGAIELFLWFSFYSFMGWVLETAFKSIRGRKFVNSGFLNGPFIPIYGFAAILVNKCFDIVQSVAILKGKPGITVFVYIILVIIVTSLLEYYTGALLEALFKRQWWDYSDQRFHIKGRISLNYSIIWGVLGGFVLRTVHPVVLMYVSLIPAYIQDTLAAAVGVFIVFDLIKKVSSLIDSQKYFGPTFSAFWRNHQIRRYTLH